MLRSKKVFVLGTIFLLFCATLAVAQSGTVNARISVTIDCTDGVCRYKVLNIPVPINYQLTDSTVKAEVEAGCGNIYYNFNDWSIRWINRTECEVMVRATYRF
jgi:hypothetical protein